MTRFFRFTLMFALVSAIAQPAHGFGSRLFGSRTSSYSSYYPSYYSGYYTAGYYYPTYRYSYYVPSYSYYIPTYSIATPVAVACPQDVAVTPTAAVPAVTAPSSINTYATPTPASPSQQTQEPPTASPPKVKEQRSFYSPSGLTQNSSAADNLKVGFWNVTSQVVTLQINGRSYQLPGNQALTLKLPRQFSWQVGGQSIRVENIPANRESFEVVLR